jgi:hypothetical protein
MRDTPLNDEQRRERFAEIVAELTAETKPLVTNMPEAHFRAMIERMAEHRLLYEEYGTENGEVARGSESYPPSQS